MGFGVSGVGFRVSRLRKARVLEAPRRAPRLVEPPPRLCSAFAGAGVSLRSDRAVLLNPKP